MTEEDLREIEDRLRASGNKPVRMVIATLSLDVEKLLAEVRRLRSEDVAIRPCCPASLGKYCDLCGVDGSDDISPNAGGGNLDE